MTTFRGHPVKPPGSANGIKTFEGLRGYVDKVGQLVSTLVQGRLNCNLEVTLTPNVGSTTITDVRISGETNPIFTPMTANAAAELGNGTLYPSAITRGSLTINHANNAQADRTFRVSLIG
jgi:hypothetical protein